MSSRYAILDVKISEYMDDDLNGEYEAAVKHLKPGVPVRTLWSAAA